MTEQLNINNKQESSPDKVVGGLGKTALLVNQQKSAGESRGDEPVFLGYTKDEKRVYDRTDIISHLHSEGGMTKELLAEALARIDTEDRKSFREIVNFERQVGETTCVEVGPEDDVVMVYRKGRLGQTPMVKNRQPEPCNSIVVVLSQNRKIEGAYELRTAFIGGNSPREAWDFTIADDAEYEEAKKFWNNHALLYDEDLIDQEKTAAYNQMSDQEKYEDQIGQRVYYSGLFVDGENLYQAFPPSLEKPVEKPHITTSFLPKGQDLHLDEIGSKAKIIAIGYGNDGKNEGLLVRIESDDPEIQKACDQVEKPHITLSTSKDGQAKLTSELEFTPLPEDKQFEITGTYGLYSRKLVLDQEGFKELAKDIKI